MPNLPYAVLGAAFVYLGTNVDTITKINGSGLFLVVMGLLIMLVAGMKNDD